MSDVSRRGNDKRSAVCRTAAASPGLADLSFEIEINFIFRNALCGKAEDRGRHHLRELELVQNFNAEHVGSGTLILPRFTECLRRVMRWDLKADGPVYIASG